MDVIVDEAPPQIFAHGLAEFRAACAAAEIGRPASREEGFAQRFAENVAHVGQAEVLQHHGRAGNGAGRIGNRSEEHTSELQSLMRISYAVFCLKKKNTVDHTYELNTKTSITPTDIRQKAY